LASRRHAYRRLSHFGKLLRVLRVFKSVRLLGVALSGLLLSPWLASAQNGNDATLRPPVKVRDADGHVTVRAVRVDTPPRVDGVLDDPMYQTLEPISGFVQQDPDEGELATEPTLVWIMFDARNIYIGARCRDSQPSRIVANDMRRDGRNVSQNDNLSVIIDTFHDRRNGYEFLMNSIGGAWDTQVTDERDANRDWNTVWTPRSRRDAEGWTVEMAIPFRSLRYRGSGPQVWGINIRRNVRWKNELSYLSPVPRLYGARGILRLSQAATLVGLEAPPASLNLEVKPYAVANLKTDRTAVPPLKDDLEPNAGFDAKYGVTPSLTADFTLRTDFAQVEDDDQQVNLTRFNLLYPEKRDFFLEGQGLFAFGGVTTTPPTGGTAAPPVNTPVLFFSRQIGLSRNREVPIDVGARLTGKAGRYSLGLLDIQTDEDETVREPQTNFAVVRLKRDILRRSYIGMIATRRAPSSAGGDNQVYGVDANISPATNLNLVGYYARTETPSLHGDDRSYRGRFDYDADLFGLQVERLAVGRHFNPEIGFLRRTDFTENLVQLRASRRPRDLAGIRKLNLEGAFDYLENGAGRLENRQVRGGLRTDMHSGDSWGVSYSNDYEFLPVPLDLGSVRIPVGTYAGGTVRANYTLGTQRKISGDISVGRGRFYDGDRLDVAYRGRAELTARLSIEPGISVNRITTPYGDLTATLLTGRGTFSFTPRMLTAALVQYNSTTHLFTTNVRYRWEYRAGSELFLVYSDGRDTLGAGAPLLLNRGLTLKITRLFRL